MAAAPKRVPLPAILLANDLLDGDVVFAADDAAGALAWTRDPAQALVAADDAAAERLEAFAATEFKAQHVVDAYLVDVALEVGGPVPRHYRERMKTLGPSNRPDLGKQAGDGIQAGRRA
jgi:sulfite reductase (NADPH) hemoprotein beta-component